MPDRILRDELLESDRWLGLPDNTCRLAFVCLIPKGDALGNMEGSPAKLLRLWRDPLAFNGAAEDEVSRIVRELTKADLVRPYEHAGQALLHIPRYRQRLRYMGRILPLSPWTTTEEKQALAKNSPGDSQVRTGRSPAEVKRSEVDVEVKRSEVKRREKVKPDAPRASRLSPDWRLPDEWKAWAAKVHHLEPAKVVRISLSFRDYWISVPGKKGTKLDWLATWRNWIRRSVGDD